MAPPKMFVRQFTFHNEIPIDDLDEIQDNNNNNSTDISPPPTRLVPIAQITLQVTSFHRRCFWVHISQSRETSHAPPPLFGPCAVALSGLTSEPASSILLLDDAPVLFGAEEVINNNNNNNNKTEVGVPPPAAALAQSLAPRLASRLQKEINGAPTAAYVSCGLTGANLEILFGTTAMGGFEVTRRFGAEVFRRVMELIREEVLGNDDDNDGE